MALGMAACRGGGVDGSATSPSLAVFGLVFDNQASDGRMPAIQRRKGDVYRVGLLPTAGAAAGFVEFDGDALSPAWAPDGQRIAFVGRVGNEFDIHVRVASGAGLVRRIVTPYAGRNPDWILRSSS